MSNEINKSLGLNPWLPAVYETPKAPQVAANEQVAHDVDMARDGLYESLKTSQLAVQELTNLALQSQSPKAYEALNNAIKTMSDISMNLAELQIKKQKLEGKNPDAKTVTNNTLVMTTEELLKKIAEAKGE